MIRTPAERLKQIAEIEARKKRDEAVLARKHAKYLERAAKEHHSPELAQAALHAYKRAEILEQKGSAE